MKINKRCHEKLKVLGLPMDVEVLSKKGKNIGNAVIHCDGTVSFQNKTYKHPSELRQKVISDNDATYRYFRFKGKLLSDWGVRP